MKRREFIEKSLLGSTALACCVLPEPVSLATSTPAIGHDWVKHCRIFIVDGYTYPLSPKIEFEAESLATTMVDMHANVVRIATVSSGGWLVPGTKFQSFPQLGHRDILAECVAACKPKGIKVVPYMSTGNVINTSMIKPEWAQKTDLSGNYSSEWDVGAKVTPVCWNTPYREAFYDYASKVAGEYDIDGMYFDAWLPFYSFAGKEQLCYCEGCQKGFQDATGKKIPFREAHDPFTAEDLLVVAHYRTWYREKLFGAFSETRRIVKSRKDIPLIYNINNPTRITNEDPRIMKGSDAFLYERGRSMIERAEGVSLAVASGLAVWPYAGTYDPFPRIAHYQFEIEQEIFTSIAFGGSPILYHSYFFVHHPEGRNPVKDSFQILEKNDRFIQGFESDKFCAVVWNNTDPPGHPIDGWLWSANARSCSLGTFTACLHNHVQTTSLLKLDLDRDELLNQYRVLVLPDITYLTDRQVVNVKKFVENGGGLVMTYATSLYNERGEKRTDFALGDLAKIRYRAPDKKMTDQLSANMAFGSVTDIYLKARSGQEVIKAPLRDGLIPVHVFETVEVLSGGTVAADLVLGTDNEVLGPGLVVSRYGKGKVAYLSPAIGSMYLQTNIREFSTLLKNAIEYVSSESLPYEIEAPQSALIANMMRRNDERVFHLINWTGSKNERMWQNVYYIPPIENVVIKFNIPEGKRIKGVQLLVPGDFKQKTNSGILTISLPRLDRYQGIAVEIS